MRYFILSAEEKLPLWQELWQYFCRMYFTDETAYEHLHMGGGSLVSIPIIVFGLFLGVVIACFAVVFNKRVPGGFVRLLLKEAALSPDTAKTLPELNCADRLYLRYAVRNSVSLRRVVRCREEEEFEAKEAEEAQAYAEQRANDPSLPKRRRAKPFAVDPDKHHFYIPENLKYTAEAKFEQKGSTWLGAVIFSVIMLVVCVVLLMFLPRILQLLNEFVGGFGAGDATDFI